VDMNSGLVLTRLKWAARYRTIVLAGDFIYALTDSTLYILSYLSASLAVLGSAESPFITASNQRLAVGGNVAYAVHGKGLQYRRYFKIQVHQADQGKQR